MASRVTALLKSRLSATEFQRFTPQDIENLVGKRFLDEAAFAEATKEVLQDLPGDPLPGLLINSILKAFNPSALQAQGKTRQCAAFTRRLVYKLRILLQRKAGRRCCRKRQNKKSRKTRF